MLGHFLAKRSLFLYFLLSLSVQKTTLPPHCKSLFRDRPDDTSGKTFAIRILLAFSSIVLLTCF